MDQPDRRRHRHPAPLAPLTIPRHAAQSIGDEHEARAILAHLPEQPDDALEERIGLVGADAPAETLQPAAALEHRGRLLRLGVQPFGDVDLVLDRLDATAEHEIRPRPVGRNQSDEIARADLAVEEVVEIFPRRAPLREIEDGAVEYEDHDAVVGIRGQLQPFARGEHGPPHVVRRAERHEIGGRDRLRLAVFEELEVVLRQALDDVSVERGIRVDPDVGGAGAEHRWPLLSWRRRRTLRHSPEQEQARDGGKRMAKHRTPWRRRRAAADSPKPLRDNDHEEVFVIFVPSRSS